MVGGVSEKAGGVWVLNGELGLLTMGSSGGILGEGIT